MSAAVLSRRVALASVKFDQAREARDQAIRAAHRGGLTIREIAPAAGLSPARVGQIVQQGG